MAKIALAGFMHETNTFSPYPTTFEDYCRKGVFGGVLQGEEILEYKKSKANIGTAGFMITAEAQGHEVVPLVWASTEPAGQVTAYAFERIMAMIISGLAEKEPFDGVFLDLHGAMVYEGYNDGETEILRRVRAIVGDVPVLASHDLHGNVTAKSIDIASAIVGYRTYPHIDMYESGERCAHILQHLLSGSALFKAFRQVPFLIPMSRQFTTGDPNKSVYGVIPEIEKDPEVISVTYMSGFPPADIEHAGPTVWAYGTTQEAADRAANQMLQAILDKEAEFSVDLPQPAEAVKIAIQKSRTADKPILLADVQDNPGIGSTSDTTGILEELIRQDAQGVALALMFDPDSAAKAHAAGERAQIELDLGGKLVPGQKPCRAVYTVEKLSEGQFQCTSPMMRGLSADLGKMAQLRIGGVRVVVSSVRTQALDREYFRRAGVNPEAMKILVVKSTNHYRAAFEPIVSEIIAVDAPGISIDDPSRVNYKNLRKGVRLKGNGPVNL